MTEQKKVEDFIENWDVDVKNKSARHKSGIGFNFEYENEDGSLYVEIEDLISWQQKMLKNGQDSKSMDSELSTLRQEFSSIYEEKMTERPKLSQQTILSSIMQKHSRN